MIANRWVEIRWHRILYSTQKSAIFLHWFSSSPSPSHFISSVYLHYCSVDPSRFPFGKEMQSVKGKIVLLIWCYFVWKKYIDGSLFVFLFEMFFFLKNKAEVKCAKMHFLSSSLILLLVDWIFSSCIMSIEVYIYKLRATFVRFDIVELMTKILTIYCILLFIEVSSIQCAASNSLSDCRAVASAFRSTINYSATNILSTTGVNVSCLISGVYCPGQNINNVCVWQRKLSAVCRNASGTIKIRIQTNNLPPRCARVPVGPFSEQNIDFEVNFNPDVSVTSLNSNLNTPSVLSQTLCTVTSVSSVPSASGFVNYGAPLNTATGVSVDGIVIFSPDSANNVDPFFPPPGFANETVDACLAHCQASGVYHYHIASGCMVNLPTGPI